MKVMLINSCFPTQSTGKIINAIRTELLNRNDDVIIAYAWDDREAEDRGNGIYRYGFLPEKYITAGLTRIDGNHFGYAWISTLRLIRFIRKENPDIINIHCANCYSCNHYILLNWCKNNNYRVVITEHAEYYYTGNCSYVFSCQRWKTGCGKCPDKRNAVKSYLFDCTSYNWNRMKKCFEGWNERMVITCVSQWQMKKSMCSPITNAYKHFCIYNGIDISTFKYREKTECMNIIKEDDYENYILFIAPRYMLGGVKGGEYILDIAKELNNFKFIVVGCSKIKGASENIWFVPYTKNPIELSYYYSGAKITLLASKRETFSLVTAESLSCGTPIVGFRCGGAESIAIKEYSEFVDYGNKAMLIESIKKWIAKKSNKKEISMLAQSKYSENIMKKEYMKVYEEILR